MASSNAALSETTDPTRREFAPDFAAQLEGLSTVALLEVCHLLREDVWHLLQEGANIRYDCSERYLVDEDAPSSRNLVGLNAKLLRLAHRSFAAACQVKVVSPSSTTRLFPDAP
jgi:hypothetical protein